jgi:uncharacterized protein
MPALKIVNNDSAVTIPQRAARNTPRVDGWNNLLTGMGIANQDKRMSTTFSAKSFMTEWELMDLYVDDGMAKKVIDLIVVEMLRKGFTIEGDKENLVLSRLQEIGAMREIERALKWDRLYGGVVIVVGIDDGGDLEMPVNEENIRDILFLRAYERYRATWTTADLYSDPKQPKYGQVQWYNIYPTSGGAIGGVSSFRVHESRCIVLEGVDIPEQARSLNAGWGTSVLQAGYEQLRSLGNVYGGLENIVEDFVFGTLSIENLQDLMMAGKENVVKERLELMDLSRHIINTVLLDAREKYEKHTSTVTGLPEIVDKFYQAVSAVFGIPMRLLVGDQGEGLNNKGEGVTDDWYNNVSTHQESKLKPIIERLAKLIFLSKRGKFKGVEPKDWKIKFVPLKQLSEKEQAEVRKINSDTDKNYVDSSVLDPAEVALSRFGGDTYGEQIELISDRTPADELGGGAEPSEKEKLELEAQKVALKNPVVKPVQKPKPKSVR